jgi:hypothetical protein
MDFKIFVYIFALFVICTPTYLFKTNIPFQELIYALLFSIIVYLTYDLVKSKSEGMDDYKINVDGVNYLNRFVKSFSNDNQDPIKISINNKIEEPIKETIYHESKTSATPSSEIMEPVPQEVSTLTLPSTYLTKPLEDNLINIDGGFPYNEGGFSKNKDYERYTRGWALSNEFKGSNEDCEKLCNEQQECTTGGCESTLYEQDGRCYCKFTPNITESAENDASAKAAAEKAAVEKAAAERAVALAKAAAEKAAFERDAAERAAAEDRVEAERAAAASEKAATEARLEAERITADAEKAATEARLEAERKAAANKAAAEKASEECARRVNDAADAAAAAEREIHVAAAAAEKERQAAAERERQAAAAAAERERQAAAERERQAAAERERQAAAERETSCC